MKRLTELAGVDVILVHRMLKNDVPISEYVLMTDDVKAKLPDAVKSLAQGLSHDFEGIGEVQTHYVDLTQVAVPPPTEPKKGAFRRFWDKVRINTLSFPQLVGISKPLDGYDRTRESITPSTPP